MRIYTPAGDLAFSTFTFPDGQPHFKLETYAVEFRSVTVETPIRSAAELLQVLLVCQVLRASGYSEVNLDIRYLLGARMDRAIGANEPFTLECVARLINSCGFNRVRILDVHSEVATRLIRNSVNVLPTNVVGSILPLGMPIWVCPDKGAEDRVRQLREQANVATTIIYCKKKRDLGTGKLSGFSVENWPVGMNIRVPFLIIDDICDGGGTFVGLAKELRKYGAEKIYLYVTHGIFSRGLPLEGIDQVYTTDSYFDVRDGVRPIVIPVSMKELR